MSAEDISMGARGRKAPAHHPDTLTLCGEWADLMRRLFPDELGDGGTEPSEAESAAIDRWRWSLRDVICRSRVPLSLAAATARLRVVQEMAHDYCDGAVYDELADAIDDLSTTVVATGIPAPDSRILERLSRLLCAKRRARIS